MSTPAVTPNAGKDDDAGQAQQWQQAASGAQNDAPPAKTDPIPANSPTTPSAGSDQNQQQGIPPAPPNVSFPATTPPPEPPVVTSQKRPGILGVVDNIADALTGRTTPEIGKDQYGNSYIKQRTLTHGEQWMRIGATLAHGAAAGLAAGKGAGNMGKAALAGFDAGAADKDKQNQQEQQMSAAARQQNLDNANNQMLRMSMAEQAFRATRLQTEATQHDVNWAQGQMDRLLKPVSEGGGGGTVLGNMAHPGDLNKILKVNPDVMADMIQKHQIEMMPHFTADGKRDGITVVKMPSGYRTTMLPAGAVFHTFNQVTGQYDEHKSADPITQGEIDDYEHSAGIAAQKFQSDKQEVEQKAAQTAQEKATASEAPSVISKNKAEASNSYSEAHLHELQAKQLNEAGSQQEVNTNAQQLVEGTMDPANLSKRSKTYDATLSAANAYSMAKYGHPFDVAKAAGDYKFATNPQTYNTLNYLNSLTGRDNKGGNLANVVAMSNKLPRTQYPPLNAVDQWAKLSAGNPQVAAYRAALVEVDDQIAKILQGGGSGGGGTSDAKMRQAAELLNKNFTPQQIAAVAQDTLRPLLANRKNEIIGTNRYLMQWHGQPQATNNTTTAPAIAPNTPPPAAGMKRIWAPGSPTWKDVPEAQVPKNVPGLVVQ